MNAKDNVRYKILYRDMIHDGSMDWYNVSPYTDKSYGAVVSVI